MVQFLLVLVIFIVAMVGFAASLHFSKYKKDGKGCCGGGHCDVNGNKKHSHNHAHSCYNDKLNYIDTKVISNTSGE